MIYRGKVDWWIGGAIVAGILFPAYASLTRGPVWMVSIPILIVAILLGFCYPQKFETAPDALIIRAGLTTRRIPYSSLTTVKPTWDSTSALAMSLDRVLVEYGSSGLMIAPDRQQEFLDDIAAHAPQLSRRGQDLAITFS